MAKLTPWTQVHTRNRIAVKLPCEVKSLEWICSGFFSFSFISRSVFWGLFVLSSTFFGTTLALAEDIKVSRSEIESFLTRTGRLETIKNWKVLFSFWEIKEGRHVRLDYGSSYEDSNQNSKIDEGDQGFFNPASTVKTAIAALVLEDLKRHDFLLSDNYRSLGQGWYTFESDIQLMQVLSDNEATNRLILYLGFDAIDSRMKELKFSDFSLERLMLGKGTLVDSPIHEVKSKGKVLSRSARSVSVKSRCEEAPGKMGNCSSHEDLLRVLIMLNSSAMENGFEIRSLDRDWLLQIMSKTPKSLGYDYPDDWNRFLQSKKDSLVGERGRMISKGGVALWSKTWTDTSLLQTEEGRSLLVAITVKPPEDVTQKMAFPFMADLALDLKSWILNY